MAAGDLSGMMRKGIKQVFKMAFTLENIKNSPVGHLNGHLFTGKVEVKKLSKYGNKKTEVDGIKFDSAKEAKRYSELKLL